jgi:protein gp37
MAKTTGIAYVRSTRNFWTGCTKVGPGCDHCYAERNSARFGEGRWGTGAPRSPHLEGAARDLRRWNRQAKQEREAGAVVPWRVFINTQSDFFDNEVPESWREFAWNVMRECQDLILILVTKRIGNAPHMLPPDWGAGYPNVWLLATVCTQKEANRDIHKLLRVPAVVHGLSMEPLLEPVDLSWDGWLEYPAGIDWVIVGGESGKHAREFGIAAAIGIVGQCKQAGVPVFVKQLGAHPVWREAGIDRLELRDPAGSEPDEWPPELRVREVLGEMP